MNAQLKYQNGNLRLNVTDDYQPVQLSTGTQTIFKSDVHTFVGKLAGQEFFIQPVSEKVCNMGPAKTGIIMLMGFTDSGIGIDFHDLYLKNVYSLSDVRAKTNIRTLNNATNTILKLNPVTYQFVNRSNDKSVRSVAGADDTETGFIAQELARVLPNSVTVTEDDKYLVNYNSIIPLLVSAIQEQNARIEVLEKEIMKLKNM